MAHALVVEDDVDFARMMATLIVKSGLTASTAGNLREARQMMAMNPPDVVLVDMELPDGNGLTLLDEKLPGPMGIVLMTGYGTMDSSIDALRRGASDYLVKPVDRRRLESILSRYRTLPGDEPRAGRHAEGFGRMVGRSAAMQSLYARIERVAPTSVPVLISGESGSGKELAAQAIHASSKRHGGPFLALNCSAVSHHLVESELFGHERGSFTGAERQHAGFFERAEGGTLFLDEVTEMPLQLQAKLLRVLESGSYHRVGSTASRIANVRIVSATNRHPATAASQGTLREDLYWRLAGFPLHLSPLRERAEDIPALARHLVRSFSRQEGVEKTLSPAALETLSLHQWPGNVRELRNIVQQGWVMAGGLVIEPTDLPPLLSVPKAVGDLVEISLGSPLAVVERQLILATLQYCGSNRERTAGTLGISLKTLYNKLKTFGVA